MACPDFQKESDSLWSNEKEPFGKKLHKLNNFTKAVSQTISSEADADKYLESIPSSTFYAQKTKLELANVLKRPAFCIDVLKSGDKLLLNRVLQFDWILNDSTKSPLIGDPNFLVENLFPSISYSCRKKVINRIGKLGLTINEGKISKIYQLVENKYGIDLAQNLLLSCEKSVIDSKIAEKRVQFSTLQIRQIYKKYPETAIQYFHNIYDELTKVNNNGWKNRRRYYDKNSYSSVLRLIAKNNPGEFMNFFEKYSTAMTNLQFGPRLTRHLFKHDKERIIKSAKTYAKLLNQQEVMKRLSMDEYKQFFISLFPENIRNFQIAFEIGMEGYRGFPGSLFSWLEKFAHLDRFNQLKESFQKVYQKNILDIPQYITSRVITLIPCEERDKWIDLRLSLPDGQYVYQATGDIPIHREGYWEAYRTIDKSIPRIKKFLSTEPDVHRRGDLLASLVLTCSINKDKSALVEVAQYVVSRFRNDSAQVRLEFLSALDNQYDILKLEDEHWTAINELMQISSINNEFSHRSTLMENILEKSIKYKLMKNKGPLDIPIQHYIKMKTRMYCRGESWCITHSSDPLLEKTCLKLFAEHLSQMFPLTISCPSDSTITSGIISLFESIAIGWNKRHSKDLMTATDFPWLISRLKEILESYHEPNKCRVITALNHDLPARSLFLSRLLKTCPLPSVLIYFLRNEPEKLDEFSNPIMDFLLRSNNLEKWSNFLEKFRSQGFPQLSEKLVNKSLEVVEDEDESAKERCNAIIILSYLLKTEHFIDWVSKFYPQDPKLDTFSDEAGVNYELRRTVAKCIKNISVPEFGLPAMVYFCKGDYLKLSLGSLYSICNRSSGTKVNEFLKQLVDRPVSLKKHAIRLILTISCKADSISFLKTLWDSEKNYSIRHIIFNRIFEFFLYNSSSEESWTLLISSIKSLTINDHPFLNELGRTDYVTSTCMPKNKLSDYLQVAWEILENLGEFGPDSRWAKANVLQCILPSNITNISEVFLESIFDKYLFLLKGDPNFQSILVQIAVSYLLHYSSSEKRVEIIGKCLKRLTTGENWKSLAKDSLTLYPAKQSLSYFIEQLSIESFKIHSGSMNTSKVQQPKDIFTKLQESLRSSLEPSDFFADDLFLTFSSIFHSKKIVKENEEAEMYAIGQEIGKLTDQVVKIYKPEIIGIFSENLKRFVGLCYKYRLLEDDGDGARIVFVIDGIINSTGSIDTQIVASHLILSSSTYLPKGHRLEEKYMEIVKKLTEVQDKTVQVFVNYRFTQSRPTSGYDILV